jgi:hypothetical protein
MLTKRTALYCLAALGALTAAAISARPKAQEFPQPNAHHAMLLEMVGTWEGTMTSSMMPGAPSQSFPMTETVEGLAPFWIQSRVECSDMMGMSFVGTGCQGFDTKKNEFVGTWIDNFGTYITVMAGEYDEAKKTLTWKYEAPDWMTGEIVPHRIETVYAGDSYTSSFFMGAAADAPATMVIEMKRKSPAAVEAGATR